MLILILIHFGVNLGQKSQSCPFWLKNGTMSIFRLLILIPTSVFSISNAKSILGQIWAEKVKVVCLAWKLTHTLTHAHAHACTHTHTHTSSYFNISISNLNLEDADLLSFGENLSRKSWILYFVWKLVHRINILRMWL